MSRARVCTIERTGGPEVIEWRDVELSGAPASDEVLIRHTAVGLNYIDTYFRNGTYPMALPGGLGAEAAGVIEAVGDGVRGFAIGDRVAYFSGPGAYATHRLIGTQTLVKLPDDISDTTAAAALLKGCTAEYLVERCGKVQAGETVLVHAVAGGVGLLLVQWLKSIGARVIGTTSSEAKAGLARSYGCDEVILYTQAEVAPRVRELTGGSGVRVVIDGVGKATFEASLDSLSPRGLMISYGNASGVVSSFDLGLLTRKGSLFVTRPSLFAYYATRDEVDAGSARLFDLIRSGALEVRIDQRYALEDAVRAHRDLEARATTGSSVLIP